MIAKPKKISKKEIQEDTLVTGYYKSLDFVEHNKNQIFIAVGAAVVIILAAFFYFSHVESQNEEAAVLIAKVLPLYDQGSYVEAAEGREGTDIKGFKYIADEYSGTDQGEIAKVYAGNALYYSGNFDDALNYYEDYSGDDKLFEATAAAGEAAVHEVKGDFEEAASKYEKAAKISEVNPMAPYYYLHAAINYRKTGNETKASALYKVLKEDYKTAQETRDAEKYLAGLD